MLKDLAEHSTDSAHKKQRNMLEDSAELSTDSAYKKQKKKDTSEDLVEPFRDLAYTKQTHIFSAIKNKSKKTNTIDKEDSHILFLSAANFGVKLRQQPLFHSVLVGLFRIDLLLLHWGWMVTLVY